jgi:hypothetical protein
MDEAESKSRAQRDLAAIKAREADVRAAIDRGDAKISGAGGFTMEQLGLRLAMVDANGRFWRDSGGGELVLIPTLPDMKF